MRVSVCVITYRRPEGLSRLISGLNGLVFDKSAPPDLEIVIVDNDPTGSACSLLDRSSLKLRWPIKYCVEPRRGIPYARNRAIAAAGTGADFIAFLDDDEVPQPLWLDELLDVQRSYDADVVQGPVLPYFPEDVPAWIVKGRFFERESVRAGYRTGQRLKLADTNNVIVRSKVFRGMDNLFDERFALTGGSDSHFFMRVFRAGYKIVWAAEASVYEWMPENRTNIKWILQRAYRRGNTLSACELDLEPSITGRVVAVVKGSGRIVQGLLLIPVSFVLGQHAFVWAMYRICYGVGRLAGVFGVRYEEYRRFFGE